MAWHGVACYGMVWYETVALLLVHCGWCVAGGALRVARCGWCVAVGAVWVVRCGWCGVCGASLYSVLHTILASFVVCALVLAIVE